MMTNWVKRSGFIAIALMVALYYGVAVSALELAIVSDLSEMANQKKIVVRFKLSAHEKALHRELLRFSSSNQAIKLRSWKASSQTKQEFNAPFHDLKKVFNEPFDIEFTFSSSYEGAALKHELAKTKIIISCVLLTDRDRHVAQTKTISLCDVPQELLNAEVSTEAVLSSSAASCDVVHDNNKTDARLKHDYEREYLKQSELFFQQIDALLCRIVNKIGYYVALISTLLFFLGMLLLFAQWRGFLTYAFLRRFIFLTVILFPLALIYVVAIWGFAGLSVAALGCYALIVGYAALRQEYVSSNHLYANMITTLGMMLLFFGFPLIAKGMLLWFFY